MDKGRISINKKCESNDQMKKTTKKKMDGKRQIKLGLIQYISYIQ